MTDVPFPRHPSLEVLTDLGLKAGAEELIENLSCLLRLASRPDLMRVSRERCIQQIESRRAETETAESFIREITSVSTSAGEPSELHRKQLKSSIATLRTTWRWRGYLNVLLDSGRDSVAEIIRDRAFSVPKGFERCTMIIPGSSSSWLDQVHGWLLQHPTPDHGKLLVLARPGNGVPSEQLWTNLAIRLLREFPSIPPHVSLLFAPTELQAFAAMTSWIPTDDDEVSPLRVMAEELNLSLESPTRREPPAIHLPVKRPIRCLASPDWDNIAEIRHLMRILSPLVGSTRASLILRHEPDIDLAPSIDLLGAAFGEVHGPDADLEVHIENSALDARGWDELGRAIDLCIELPSKRIPQSASRLATRPSSSDPESLTANLLALEKRIAALPLLCLC